MQKALRLVCGVGLLSLAFAPLAAAEAESVDDVIKKITEMNKNVKSMKADIKTVTKIENEMMKQNSTSDGQYEYMLKDGKTYVRMEGTTTGTMEMMGNKQETKGTNLTVMDGEYSWSLTEQDGQKFAQKMKITDEMTPADPFAGVRDNFNMKLLPDETVDGESCYVIELTPKTEEMGSSRMLQYYRKDNGTISKVVSFDGENKPIMTMTYTNVKVNPSLSADRFKFTPPAGVEVMDLSDQDMGGMSDE